MHDRLKDNAKNQSNQKKIIKLIGKDINFLFKPMNFFFSIQYDTIFKYKLLTA